MKELEFLESINDLDPVLLEENAAPPPSVPKRQPQPKKRPGLTDELFATPQFMEGK